MASIDQYKIKISVEGQQAVDRLKDSVGALDSTLAKIGFAAFVAGAFRMADAMTDISDATGIALENVIAFSQAMSAAGGDADNADKALVTFYKNLQDMADGSDQAEEKLNKVGITMSDLKTLSEEQLLQKAIDNLADMKDGADRATAGIDAFGKSFNTIDPTKFKETFDPGKTKDYAIAMKQAGDAVDNLAKNFKILQMAVINVFGPLLNQLSQFKIDIGTAQKLIVTVSALFAANFGAKAAGFIYDIVKAIQAWNAATKGQITLQAVLLALSGPRGWAMIAGAAAAGTVAVLGLNKALEANAQAQKDAASAGGDIKTPGAGAYPLASEFATKEKEQRELAAKAAMRETGELAKQFAIQNKLAAIIKSTIGMDKDRAELIKTTAQITADYETKRNVIIAAINTELAKGKEANLGIVEAKKQEYAILEKQELKEKEINRTTLERQKQIEAYNNALEQQLKNIEIINDAENYKVEQQIKSAEINGTATAKQIQQALDLFNLERNHIKILKQLDKDKAQAKDKLTKENLDNEAKREIERYNLAKQVIEDRYKFEEDLQNSWRAGTIKALEQITNAMEPYQQAQDVIAATWSKLGNAVDTFVETGKFKFSDFAKSVVADIAKIILKAQILKAIGFVFGALKIPGFANGGSVDAGQPIMVGEKGPELFVPPTAGKIVPNNQLNQGTSLASKPVNAPITNNYITNNISALDAKSVAQLFAENRKTLLGSVKMAEREMPYMGR